MVGRNVCPLPAHQAQEGMEVRMPSQMCRDCQNFSRKV